MPADSISWRVLFMASVLFRLSAMFLGSQCFFPSFCHGTVASIFSSLLRFVWCYKGVKMFNSPSSAKGRPGKSAILRSKTCSSNVFQRSLGCMSPGNSFFVSSVFVPFQWFFLPALRAFQKDHVWWPKKMVPTWVPLQICTDSQLVVDTVLYWLAGWERRG